MFGSCLFLITYPSLLPIPHSLFIPCPLFLPCPLIAYSLSPITPFHPYCLFHKGITLQQGQEIVHKLEGAWQKLDFMERRLMTGVPQCLSEVQAATISELHGSL